MKALGTASRTAAIGALATSIACASQPSSARRVDGGPLDVTAGASADAAMPGDGGTVGLDAQAIADGSAAPDTDGGLPDAALVFDLGADFSFARNPNGVWRYGYTTGAEPAVDQVALDTFVPDSGGDPVAFWHPYETAIVGAGYYPYVAENAGDVAVSEEASWAVRAQEVAMEGSNSGQYSVVQFVAPRPGTYQVHAHFEGIHFRLSTTDVHVLAGDAGIFAASIDGYGGDPAFHAVEGGNPAADYDGAVPLQVGDLVTFAIGYGRNKTNYNDTTGLTARIVFTGD